MIDNLDRVELIAPCHFGLEAVLKREILDLGTPFRSVNLQELRFISLS